MKNFFYTHANNRTGFGHLARCINISKILLSLDKTLKIYFAGRFKNFKRLDIISVDGKL